MMPAPKNIVISIVNSSGRCPNEPSWDSPYAASTLTTTDSAVPTSVTPRLTSTARVTTPPVRISWYADTVSPSGTTTSPPAAVITRCGDRLVTTTTYSGKPMASSTTDSVRPFTPRPASV